MVHILHDLHPQAGDDEEESGPNMSQVTGPEESAACTHMSPIPHMTRYEETTTGRPRNSRGHGSVGNCAPSFAGIGVRFYETLW